MSARDGELAGRVALVTGAARGVGRAIAVELARAGADVALLDRCAPLATAAYKGPSPEDLDETRRLVEEAGRRAFTTTVDVTDGAGLERAVAATGKALGPIEVAVCNAGVFTWGRLWELTEEQWDETVDINLKGVWLTLKAVVPGMIERRAGRLVVVSSTAGLRGCAEMAHYTASKHGVIGLAKSLALEVGRYGITVNAVCPTRLETDMVTFDVYYEKFAGGEGATRADLVRATRSEQALAIDLVPPTAVAAAVRWLVSDAAACVTGTALPVDAGELLV